MRMCVYDTSKLSTNDIQPAGFNHDHMDNNQKLYCIQLIASIGRWEDIHYHVSYNVTCIEVYIIMA